jgi:hypothetical protein
MEAKKFGAVVLKFVELFQWLVRNCWLTGNFHPKSPRKEPKLLDHRSSSKVTRIMQERD